MEPKKQNNILTISMILLFIAVIYLTIQNNKLNLQISYNENNKQEELILKKKECMEAGEKLYQADINDVGKNYLFTPEYTYNESLNTCLYFGGYIDPENDWVSKWVKDSYTNTQIISFMSSGDDVVTTDICSTCVSNDVFMQKQKELFQ